MSDGSIAKQPGTKPNDEKRTFIKLGYTKKGTDALIKVLNQLLANYTIHYQKLRNFHWNVKGADFFDLHEQFEQQYNFARVAIDDIAERIRVFGQSPHSTLRSYLDNSEIEEVETILEAKEMVKEVLNDYRILLESMFDVLDEAISQGDSATEELVKEFIKYTEKNHWMMTSFVTRNE